MTRVLCKETACIWNEPLEEEEFPLKRGDGLPGLGYRGICGRDIIGISVPQSGHPECFSRAAKHIQGHMDPSRWEAPQSYVIESMDKAKKLQREQRNRAEGIPNFFPAVEIPTSDEEEQDEP